MDLIRFIFVIVQIYVCHSLLRISCLGKDEKTIKKILNYRGWAELKNKLPETNEKQILLEALNNSNENDKIYYAANVLSELYGTLQLKIYGFYHCISNECIAKENDNVEFLLTEFKKLAKMINVFDPLLQCMNKALDYLDSQSYVHNLLHDSINKYKEIDEFLLDENLQKLKKESSRYELDVLEKHKEVNSYHLKIFYKKIKINNLDYNKFVENYIDQFKNLSNHEKRYYPDPNHVEMKKKVKAGVQKFCKDFGFN